MPLPTYGQIPIPGLPQLATGASALPRGVTRQGQVESTGVYLDGRALFDVASPTVLDRAQPGNLIPVEDRAREIEARLRRLVSRDTDKASGTPARDSVTRPNPNTLRVRIEAPGGRPVLVASDASGAEPLELLRVTDTDALHHGLPAPELAARWQQTLEQGLRSALESRQPEVTGLRLLRLGAILLTALLSSVMLGKLVTVLGKRRDWLKQQQQRAEQATASQSAASQDAAAKAAAPHAGTSGTEGEARDAGDAARRDYWEKRLLSHVLREQLSFARRRQVIRLLRRLIAWAIVFIWVAAMAGVLYQFPQTRGLADTIVSIPVLILITWFAAGLVNGLVGLLIDRVANGWSRADDVRTSLRVPTIVSALKGLSASVLYTVAVIAVLGFLQVIPFTVVALGAIVAFALSFAAQNLVKDLLNGLLILVEDQYALGDYIVIGEASGVVERLNLRITQLRTPDGRLITIPNHQVNTVENKTRLWSRVDLNVTVAYATDVDRALAVVGRVAEETAHDPQWRALILDAPQLLGVEEISHAGIVIRVWVQTLPFNKEQVARELRRRLKIAFDREDIRLGIPQQAILIEAARGQPQGGGLLPGDEGRDRSKRERPLQVHDANS